jgi:hypothetical protein
MIVSTTTYYLVVITIVVLIISKPLYTRLVLKQGNKYDAMCFLLFILLPINWYTPAIITVLDCNKYTKEIALFPVKKDNVEISYGKHLYVFNKSKNTVVVEDLVYGHVDEEDVNQKQIIEPNHNGIVKKVIIDYIFEEPEESVSSKSDGEVKTSLYCIN